ncbi:asparaginyl-tRNA synthetase [Marinitoga piezophila KA3]|uniref:Asparagine--tRNA ligase n=1 Tax=Marinitoga piezophila (strain DSM 14283 / JCM 11233 / KA3) TaxID=443254 RepID=H2J6Y1_MARPK|nr:MULTISPECIES: asparagine--tRNA ligase [Marinitoga]AEX85246.1 asparaginyl-tRNA synthetase [Marinitoga piezophila KA3]APT75734.1 asparagine--tRNA ligase [Marinitoga sp. 1137]
MEWIYIKDMKKHIGEKVEFRGWLWNKRVSGKIGFLQLRDGTGFVQGVVEKSTLGEEKYKEVKKLKMESSLIVRGTVVEDQRSPVGFELHIDEVEIVHNPSEDYPISKKEHGIDFLMEHRHLWLRSRRQFHILKVRHEIIKAIREFYNNEGFVLIDTPIFTGSIGESAGNTFEIDYFDYGKVYLAQTGQLYLEAAAMALGKVYNLGPTFRAEKSKTRRHLIEFWMNEAEVAYYTHEDNMRLQENLVSYVVKKVLENASENLVALGRDISKLEKIEAPFPRITYTEAIKLLNKKGSDIQWGEDLGADDETLISEEFDKPVIIEKYPKSVKAFYMQPDPENPDVVLCDDMIAPEGYGEIIGASERIWQEDVLIERLKENNLPVEEYQWYLDLRKFGSVPHSGFGLGIERTVAWICGLKHIREAIPFARTLYRVYP